MEYQYIFKIKLCDRIWTTTVTNPYLDNGWDEAVELAKRLRRIGITDFTVEVKLVEVVLPLAA